MLEWVPQWPDPCTLPPAVPHRWREALEAGCAPPVWLAGTNRKALDYVSLEQLLEHALDKELVAQNN